MCARSLPPPKKRAQSGGELLRAGCAAWRWLRRKRCALLLWRAALFRLSSACYEIKNASPSPWVCVRVCVRRPAFSLNHLRSTLESINPPPKKTTASHFVMERPPSAFYSRSGGHRIPFFQRATFNRLLATSAAQRASPSAHETKYSIPLLP